LQNSQKNPQPLSGKWEQNSTKLHAVYQPKEHEYEQNKKQNKQIAMLMGKKKMKA